MKIVADTNAFLAVALGEPERTAILRATRKCDLTAPEVLPFEIGNALTAMVKRGALTCGEVMAVWEAVQCIPVELRQVDIQSAVEIALEHDLYAYDAYFLECSISQGCPLLSLDRRLLRVAENLGLSILEVTSR